MQIAEVHFPAGARVAFEAMRDQRVYQQIWVLEGEMEVSLADEIHRLRERDCLAMQLDRPAMFHNPTRKRARYAVVIASMRTAPPTHLYWRKPIHTKTLQELSEHPLITLSRVSMLRTWQGDSLAQTD